MLDSPEHPPKQFSLQHPVLLWIQNLSFPQKQSTRKQKYLLVIHVHVFIVKKLNQQKYVARKCFNSDPTFPNNEFSTRRS